MYVLHDTGTRAPPRASVQFNVSVGLPPLSPFSCQLLTDTEDTLSETVTFVNRLGQGKSRKNYVVSISNRFKRNLQDKRLLWTRPENIKSTFMCFDVV